MTITEYRQLSARTLPDLGGDKLNLSHMALGLASELGELTNCVGTELKHKIDRVNLLEELGDIYWYLANYSNIRGIPLPETLKVTIENDLALDLMISGITDLVDIVKKYMAYNRPIEVSKELELVYDIMCALQLFEGIYELDGNEVRQKNIIKLQIRYPEKFTDNAAINRDTDAERKSLES